MIRAPSVVAKATNREENPSGIYVFVQRFPFKLRPARIQILSDRSDAGSIRSRLLLKLKHSNRQRQILNSPSRDWFFSIGA